MWPFRKKSTIPQNQFHGFDLNVWDYLGWSEIRYDHVPSTIHFFWKKGDDDIRAYTLTGGSDFHLKTIARLHSYVHKTCELWRIHEIELYTPVRYPSKFLKEWMFSEYGYAWNDEKTWWVIASDQDKYEYSAVSQKDKPKIIENDNVLTIDFKNKK
jgi:hypothetical protein